RSLSDTAQWSARGTTMANLILANQNQAVADTWLASSVVNNSFGTYVSGNVAYVAARGAQFVSARDATASATAFHTSQESWINAKDEALDATGKAWISV